MIRTFIKFVLIIKEVEIKNTNTAFQYYHITNIYGSFKLKKKRFEIF